MFAPLDAERSLCYGLLRAKRLHMLAEGCRDLAKRLHFRPDGERVLEMARQHDAEAARLETSAQD